MPSHPSVPTRRAVLAAGAALSVTASLGDTAPPFGRVHRLDPALDALIAPDAEFEQIASGIKWAEGPVWVKNGGFLLFSDPPMNTMYRWSRTDGQSVYMHPSGYAGPDTPTLREAGSNGLAIDAAGALIICDSGDRSLVRYDFATKTRTTLAGRFEGKRFNSPNDCAIAKSGAIYFTDPPYGLADIEKSPIKELPYSGIYRWTPDGKVALIDKSFLYPNGIALSPDETTLYADNTDPANPIIRAYRLGADGLPVGFSTLYDTKPLSGPGVRGNPDGMKIDALGNLYAAGPGGLLVISPQGKLLGAIEAPGRTTPNCAFGEDGMTLFFAATDAVGRIRLKVKGAGWA
jgi:gluconolactonase